MISSGKNVTLLLTWLVLSTIAAANIFQRDKATVRIYNELAPTQDAFVNCHSEDNLGNQTIKPHALFQFQFRPDIWGTTYYNCSFVWTANTRSFMIYGYRRDHKRCRKYCYWQFTNNQICLYNIASTRYDQCTNW
jgi:hypothetical protein